MSTPAIITICFIATTLTARAIFHGRETRINFFAALADAGIVIGLLIWGGFFS